MYTAETFSLCEKKQTNTPKWH